ncbi:hypothetical protein HCH04_14920 [Bacteroides thetaiotaomicron]|uniref:Rrf2 family transcriptional regulator n=1 Tax=Bacteroides thetaiotaomicron TaxID=818 RepID=UPI001C8CD04F|nr:Rrf2 family transcriptional regulator [Bacteroides thetaiotaomicron]MBX9049603.1 hypothetical protein [Bacteroides thetaiotaomicron]MBX9074253.1 hypothetical protein [Bacteroides thetaiotaomicron]
MLISERAHCALIIVVELAKSYATKGVPLEEISGKHHLPMDSLMPVSDQLCAEGLVAREKEEGAYAYLFLKSHPQDISAYDIVKIFDSELFMGKFLNDSTGKWLPQSKVSRFINYERKQYLSYLRRKLRHVNIGRWCEQMDRSGDNIYYASNG